MNNPYILLADCAIYVVTDRKVVCPIPNTRDIPMVLFASYYGLGHSPQVVPKNVFTHLQFIYMYVNTYIFSIHAVLEK